MKYLLVVFLILCACGSKKEFTRSESIEGIRTNEQFYAELYQTTRLLEFLDVKIKLIETLDSSGNVRKETNIRMRKKTDHHNLDTTKVTVKKQEEGEKVINLDTKKERSGVLSYWVWVIGFIAVIVLALLIGICVMKRKSIL